MSLYAPKTVLLCTAIMGLISCQSVDAITYRISPREGVSDSWGLIGGSITTDGTIGEISPANFESWELRFSSPSGESVISSDHGLALLVIETFTIIDPYSVLCCHDDNSPHMSANEEQILLVPGSFGVITLDFVNQDIFSAGFDGKAVSFFPAAILPVNGFTIGGRIIDNSVDASNPFDPYTITIDPTIIPSSTLSTPLNNPNRAGITAPPGPLVIGSITSVPEPSTITLLLIAVVGLRHGRERRVQPTCT